MIFAVWMKVKDIFMISLICRACFYNAIFKMLIVVAVVMCTLLLQC